MLFSKLLYIHYYLNFPKNYYKFKNFSLLLFLSIVPQCIILQAIIVLLDFTHVFSSPIILFAQSVPKLNIIGKHRDFPGGGMGLVWIREIERENL